MAAPARNIRTTPVAKPPKQATAAAQRPVRLWDRAPTERASLTKDSAVKAAAPFSQSMARQYSQPTQAYAGYGSSAGEKSLNAWSQAAAMQQKTAATGALDELSRNYQNKAQQVRAGDVFNQRADQVRRFGLNEGQRADLRGQNVNFEQQRLNLANQVRQAQANSQNNILNSTLGLVAGGGILNSLTTVGALRAAAPASMGGGGLGMSAFGPVGRGLMR